MCLYDGLHLQKNMQRSFKSITETIANSSIVGPKFHSPIQFLPLGIFEIKTRDC